MKKSAIGFCLVLASFAQPSVAQTPRPSVMVLAQAHDRCMTIVAVRESKVNADDEVIYEHAKAACEESKGGLFEAIRAERPSEQAEGLIDELEAQAKPNFLNMLRRIRADRQSRN